MKLEEVNRKKLYKYSHYIALELYKLRGDSAFKMVNFVAQDLADGIACLKSNKGFCRLFYKGEPVIKSTKEKEIWKNTKPLKKQ